MPFLQGVAKPVLLRLTSQVAADTWRVSNMLCCEGTGLPIGLQFTGPAWSESLLLRAAAALEARLGPSNEMPAVHLSESRHSLQAAAGCIKYNFK